MATDKIMSEIFTQVTFSHVSQLSSDSLTNVTWRGQRNKMQRYLEYNLEFKHCLKHVRNNVITELNKINIESFQC